MGKIEKIVKKHKNGALLNLFVTPSSRNTIFPAGFNSWRKCIEIHVPSPNIDNKANKDVILTVADFFDKSFKDVFVLKGSKKREKTVFVKDISVDFVSNRLRESLNEL
jgi:uncharacterized protein (TIGR00251 family)